MVMNGLKNFDGKIIKNNNIYYFNLKFICDTGGSQTRTLREIYIINTIIKLIIFIIYFLFKK